MDRKEFLSHIENNERHNLIEQLSITEQEIPLFDRQFAFQQPYENQVGCIEDTLDKLTIIASHKLGSLVNDPRLPKKLSEEYLCMCWALADMVFIKNTHNLPEPLDAKRISLRRGFVMIVIPKPN